MDHNVNSSKNLVYTDLQTCSLPCGQNKFTENISSTDNINGGGLKITQTIVGEKFP
jgi:hypothetical protein